MAHSLKMNIFLKIIMEFLSKFESGKIKIGLCVDPKNKNIARKFTDNSLFSFGLHGCAWSKPILLLELFDRPVEVS